MRKDETSIDFSSDCELVKKCNSALLPHGFSLTRNTIPDLDRLVGTLGHSSTDFRTPAQYIATISLYYNSTDPLGELIQALQSLIDDAKYMGNRVDQLKTVILKFKAFQCGNMSINGHLT